MGQLFDEIQYTNRVRKSRWVEVTEMLTPEDVKDLELALEDGNVKVMSIVHVLRARNITVDRGTVRKWRMGER